MMTRFFKLYDQVFDENGEVKACGRKVCQEIILLSDQIEHGVKHGDPYTCFMDVESIKALKSKLDANKKNK